MLDIAESLLIQAAEPVGQSFAGGAVHAEE